jgi:hypothetical protein
VKFGASIMTEVLGAPSMIVEMDMNLIFAILSAIIFFSSFVLAMTCPIHGA